MKVLLPAAAPAILVGARLCLGTTLVMAIIAEMIGNPHGLGYAVVSALMSIQPEQMFAYVLFIGVLAIALNGCLLVRRAPPVAGLWPRGHDSCLGARRGSPLCASAFRRCAACCRCLLCSALWQVDRSARLALFPAAERVVDRARRPWRIAAGSLRRLARR